MKLLFISLLIGIFSISCNSNEKHKVSSKTEINQTKTIKSKPISELWLGKWERLNWKNESTLTISKIEKDSIVFSLFALSGGHIGDIEGKAFVNGNIATYSNQELDDCLIEFKLIGDTLISIEQKKGICFAGMGVYYSGNYKNYKLLPNRKKTENLKSLEIFNTQKEDSLFKILVGDSYDLFVNTTQLTSVNEDLDNFNATVKSSGIRGFFTFMENIIMKDSSNNFWAAVLDEDKIYYFTNKNEYKKRLPKTIENWRKSFKEYPVIYK